MIVHLPELWHAIDYVEPAPRGTRDPHFFDCVHSNTDRPDILLVKQLDPCLMTSEFFGCHLARAFGLLTPLPGIVLITEEAVESARIELDARDLFCPFREGLAVGSVKTFLPRNLRLEGSLASLLLKDALRLFCFDMLAGHHDRAYINPNCAQTADRLIVYDFEQTFPEEERDMVSKGPPWTGATRGLALIHCLHRHLRGKGLSLDFLQPALAKLVVSEWQAFIESLPEDWQAHGQKIWTRIKSIYDHVELFEQDLTEALR